MWIYLQTKSISQIFSFSTAASLDLYHIRSCICKEFTVHFSLQYNTVKVLTSNFHAGLTHSESISCHTTKPPSSDSSDFCSKTYTSYAGSGSFYSSVYEIIPMNLHVSLHTTLLTSRPCKGT